jgi:hypothetical protein
MLSVPVVTLRTDPVVRYQAGATRELTDWGGHPHTDGRRDITFDRQLPRGVQKGVQQLA